MHQKMKHLSRSLSTNECYFSLSICPPHPTPSVSQGAISLKLQHAHSNSINSEQNINASGIAIFIYSDLSVNFEQSRYNVLI